MKSNGDLKLETNVPVVVTDHQGFITYVNDRFTVVFGWTLAEIIGQNITIIIPEGFHAPHHIGFSRFLATEKSTILNHPLKLKGITKAGKEIAAEHFIQAEQQEGRWVFYATLRPL